MKHRLDRVNEVMKRELGELLRREFTFTAKLVTVQQVDITPDLKQAHVFVSIIGTPDEQRAAMAQLHDGRIALQQELAKRVVLKHTPRLHFNLDDTIERGDRVLNVLETLEIPDDPQPLDDEALYEHPREEKVAKAEDDEP
jgi:ribosome-binding factor A